MLILWTLSPLLFNFGNYYELLYLALEYEFFLFLIFSVQTLKFNNESLCYQMISSLQSKEIEHYLIMLTCLLL